MLKRRTVKRLSDQTRSLLSRWQSLRPLLANTYLWQFSRRSVSVGAAVGVFFGIVVPFAQSAAAAVAALFLRGNLPVAVLATFITNPLTVAPLYYGMYRLGALLLGMHGPLLDPELSLLKQAGEVGTALLVGVPIGALALALLTYVGVNVVWVGWVARRRWPLLLRVRRARQQARESAQAENSTQLRRSTSS